MGAFSSKSKSPKPNTLMDSNISEHYIHDTQSKNNINYYACTLKDRIIECLLCKNNFDDKSEEAYNIHVARDALLDEIKVSLTAFIEISSCNKCSVENKLREYREIVCSVFDGYEEHIINSEKKLYDCDQGNLKEFTIEMKEPFVEFFNEYNKKISKKFGVGIVHGR